MKEVFLILAFVSTNSGVAAPKIQNVFAAVMTKPSQTTLNDFEKVCKEGSALGFESALPSESRKLIQLANQGLKSKNIFAVRALIKAMSCTGQGASTEWVAAFLGNEVLMESPELLIKGIHLEDQEKQLG